MKLSQNIINNKQILFLMLVFIFSNIFILSFYSDIVISPNSFLFSDGGDGISSYYNSSYHIKHDTSYLQFDGMNYPYSEHITYSVNNPLLTNSVKLLAAIFPKIANHTVGIINISIIFSFLLCAIFLYLIFTKLKIQPIFSVINAIAISMLSPQVFRMTGHLSLAYVFFIPLTLYLFMLFLESENKLKWTIFIFINNLFWVLIHPYYTFIVVFFISLYYLISLFQNFRKTILLYKTHFFIIVQTILPLIIFYFLVKITDEHTGRTNNPYGFFVYLADFKTIFLPSHPPLKPIIESFAKIGTQNWEGVAYVGLSTILVLGFLLINSIKKFIKAKKIFCFRQYLDNEFLRNGFLASVLILLFSMGYPFIFNLEFVIDLFPILKSFRSTGRFSWIFFYFSTIVAVYVGYKLVKKLSNRNKILSGLVFFIIPFLFFVEAFPYHQELSERLVKTSNLFDKNQLNGSYKKGLDKIDSENFQAIIPIPFYHKGSENYGKSASKKILLLSEVFSYHKKLPILGSYLARTSIWESKNIVQLISPDYYEKEIEKDIFSNKPFLIISSNETITDYEQMLIQKCDTIYTSNEFSLLSISLEKLFDESEKNSIVEDFIEKRDSLLFVNDFFLSDYTDLIDFDDFEDSKSQISYRSNGAFKGTKNGYSLLAKIDSSLFVENQEYVASFWIYNCGENYGQDVLNSLFIVQEDNGISVKWNSIFNPSHSFIIDNCWSLVECNFKIKNEKSSISFLLKGDDNTGKNIYVDDLLIYKKDAEVYQENKNELFFNNHRITVH
ncbi:MAG: hypothetical protein HN704_13870 [Bacteroidetes bacterium]|jgi:hypothetical protein|nr:hypothetical protein [Bacteroidota bacterium]MBT6686882.1 hypothetical protein [Bacteroidota bacterium]MBT7141858.1 hypothetical protein [Bacteroidota bacterium]MBT7492684.1 hypothetical protein [Bacteroidota bacterium]